jgi:hypothetical protein
MAVLSELELPTAGVACRAFGSIEPIRFEVRVETAQSEERLWTALVDTSSLGRAWPTRTDPSAQLIRFERNDSETHYLYAYSEPGSRQSQTTAGSQALRSARGILSHVHARARGGPVSCTQLVDFVEPAGTRAIWDRSGRDPS